MLGDAQFAVADEWEAAGRLALCGIGVEPGLSDVFARYAADHLFERIDEIGVRDGADLAVDGYAFAPTFSIWTTIEECLNPPLIWERERGWYTTAPFSEPEVFEFPAGIGPVECVNVEHEEVVLDPALGRLRARHVQVRARRRVHRRAQDAQPARARLDRAAARQGRRGRAARRRRRRAARPRDARRPHDRPHVRGHARHRHRQGRRAARGLPLPRRRQRGDDGARRRPGGRLADRDQPGRGAGAARDRRRGRARACSGRRRSTRSRSSTCSPSTAARTGSRSAIRREPLPRRRGSARARLRLRLAARSRAAGSRRRGRRGCAGTGAVWGVAMDNRERSPATSCYVDPRQGDAPAVYVALPRPRARRRRVGQRRA